MEKSKLGYSGYLKLNVAEIVLEGFLMRTTEREMVVSNWVPQQSVLSHPSAGGFITHCGWNSSMASIWNSVPMVTWLLFVKQRMNRLLLIKEIGVVVDLDMDVNGFVKAESVESAVKELMCGEEGRKAGEKAQLLMVSARSALGDSGSLVVTLTQLQHYDPLNEHDMCCLAVKIFHFREYALILSNSDMYIFL